MLVCGRDERQIIALVIQPDKGTTFFGATPNRQEDIEENQYGVPSLSTHSLRAGCKGENFSLRSALGMLTNGWVTLTNDSPTVVWVWIGSSCNKNEKHEGDVSLHLRFPDWMGGV